MPLVRLIIRVVSEWVCSIFPEQHIAEMCKFVFVFVFVLKNAYLCYRISS